jgi:S-layer protein
MTITTTERTQIIELTTLMFNAAPGATYLTQIVALYEGTGRSLQTLADTLSGTSVYQSLNPNFQSVEEFAAEFLAPLGLAGDAIAIDFIVSRLDAGQSKASIVFQAFNALNGLVGTDAARYQAAKATLLNKTSVAEYFSVTKEAPATDLPTLQAVISGVDSTLASVVSAVTAIDHPTPVAPLGSTFGLTINEDDLTGTAGNDQFFAGVTAAADGIHFVDTLQNFDRLDGGAGVDTLTVTLNDPFTVTPTLAAIENIVLRSTGVAGAVTLDLSASTGIQKVTVANSSGQAAVGSVGDIANLGVSHQNQDVFFSGVTAPTLALSLDNVGRVSANPTVAVQVVVDLGDQVASKSTTLNITAVNSNVDVQDTTGGSVATGATIVAIGANELMFENGATTLASLTITGTGSVDLSGISLVALGTLTVGDGGVTFTNAGSAATTFSAITGAGADSLTVEGANVETISTGAGDDAVAIVNTGLATTAFVDLGAGNDILTLAPGTSVGAIIDGGAGTDTLVMDAADAAAASADTLFATDVTGFEVLGLVDHGAQTVDVDVLGNFNVVITGGASGALVMDGFTSGGSLTLTSAVGAGSYTVSSAAFTAPTTDVFNIAVTAAASTAAGQVTANNIETINLSSNDTVATDAPGAITNSLALVADSAETITITGNANLNLTSANATVTSVEASTMTGGLTYTTAGTTAETVQGGRGVNALTAHAGTAADTLIGGASADTLTANAGLDTLTGGAGADHFVIATPSANVNSYATITDASKGDVLKLASAGIEVFSSATISLGATAVFHDFANAAINAGAAVTDAAGVFSGNAFVTWFQFGSDTYVVQALHDSTTLHDFQNGTDVIVKLTGLHDLSTALFDTAGTLLIPS